MTKRNSLSIEVVDLLRKPCSRQRSELSFPWYRQWLMWPQLGSVKSSVRDIYVHAADKHVPIHDSSQSLSHGLCALSLELCRVDCCVGVIRLDLFKMVSDVDVFSVNVKHLIAKFSLVLPSVINRNLAPKLQGLLHDRSSDKSSPADQE